MNCIADLPHTNEAGIPDNTTEKILNARLPIKAAFSEFHFSKGQLIQQLIHELKYKGNKQIGFYLGEIMGNNIIKSERFPKMDFLIPLPLFADKEFKRGFNQSEIICNGISSVTNIPVLNKIVIRKHFTETQTKKHRTERWQNVEGSFAINNPEPITGKNILLIDDVITTGATLEACGQAILQIPGVSLSIAALAHAGK